MLYRALAFQVSLFIDFAHTFYKLVLYWVIVFIVVRLVPVQPTKTELISVALDLYLGGARFVSRSGYRTS
jgi:hypothetical protein